MSYLGNIGRCPTNYPPRQMLAAWSTNLHPQGGVFTTNKKALVCSLHTLPLSKKMIESITTTNKTIGKNTSIMLLWPIT